MKPQTITYTLHDPNIDRIVQEETAGLLSDAKKLGRNFGIENQPEVIGDPIGPYIDQLRTRAQKGRSRILEQAKPEVRAAEAKLDLDTAKKKCSDIDDQTEELSHQNKVALLELDGKPRPPCKKKSLKSTLFTIAVYAGDIALNATALEFGGDSLLFSAMIGLLLAVGTDLSSRGVLYFLHCRKKLGNLAYAAIAGIIAAILPAYYGLAQLRSSVLHNEDSLMGAGFFLGMNVFVFVIVLLLRFFFFPPDDETDETKELRTKFEQCDDRENQIETLKKAKETIQVEYKKRMMEHMQAVSIASRAIDHIHAVYWESIALFKSTNLLCRKDKKMPECFSDSAPDLEPMTPIQPLNLPTP